MAFKYKQHEDGLPIGQKMGQFVSVYGKYAATSGFAVRDIDIYERDDDGNWTLLSSITLAAFASLGYGLSMHKEVLLTGAPRLVGPGQRGAIYTKENNFAEGTEVTLLSTSPKTSAICSVSLSDTYATIGYPDNPSGIHLQGGDVHIYTKQNDVWEDDDTNTEVIITAADAAASQLFGTSVTINENFLIVGAKGDNNSRGAVYVFERNEDTDVWEQKQKIIASDGAAGDEFGGAVSISGDYFAVGAEFADSSDTEVNVGAVYIYNYSNTWNELRKITSVNESGLIANNFGHSLDLQGDYLIVGSPNAQNSGVADIFYKKRNWGHLKKIDSSLTSTGDSFGESVGIFYPYAVVGAFNYSAGSLEGRTYFYEDPPVRLRLAQEFDVNEEFLPSKASVYLKRSGENANTTWSLQSSSATIIDATNFSSISQSTNKIIFDDRISGYTGNGYMSLAPDDEFSILNGSDSSFPVVNYPIRNSVPTAYSVWVHCHSGSSDPSGSSNFDMDLILDGVVVKNISSTISNDSWVWLNTTLVLPDTQQHTLGIKMKEKGSAIDKIYIDADSSFTPEGDGPPYLTSPYITIHMKVYDGYNFSSPVDPLYVYDYKTTLDEVIQDDWYNFNISVLDSRAGYDLKEDFANNFFLVLSSTGSNADNFILWELQDKDEYSSQNSAIKI